MFEPVLDPFYRPCGDAGGDGGENDIGKHALLDAEGAAGIGRRAQPHTVAGHVQGAGNHRMDRERTLKICRDVIGVLAWIVFRDDAVGFDRRAGIARIGDADGNAVGGPPRAAASGSP